MSKTIEEIKEDRAQECLASNWSHLLVVGLTNTDVDYIAERYAQSQTQELTAWKESMMKVHNELDLQGIAKSLGLPLGSTIAPQVLPKIKELQDQNAELVEMLEDMETAWQSLPYGHNSVRDTQNWISNSIHPQILRMREWVSKHKTKHNHLKSNTNGN